MKLKSKNQMTGKELCDLEGIIFPMLSQFPELSKKDVKVISDFVTDNGEEIVKLCYVSDNGNAIQNVDEPYRMKLLEDFQEIISFIMDTGADDEGKLGKKVTKIDTKR